MLQEFGTEQPREYETLKRLLRLYGIDTPAAFKKRMAEFPTAEKQRKAICIAKKALQNINSIPSQRQEQLKYQRTDKDLEISLFSFLAVFLLSRLTVLNIKQAVCSVYYDGDFPRVVEYHGIFMNGFE